MKIFKIFQSRSKWFFLFLGLMAIINSLITSGLLIIINSTLTGKELLFGFGLQQYVWLIFLGLLVMSFAVKYLFQSYTIRLTNGILYDFEMMVVSKVRKTLYQSFEKLGKERIYTAFGDVRALSELPEFLINFISSCIICLCCIGYIFWASPLGGVIVTGVMFVLLLIYVVRNKKIEEQLNVLRDKRNKYQAQIIDFLYGFKELKTSLLRNENLFQQVSENRSDMRYLGIDTSIKYLNNELTGSYSWYVVIGVIIFLLPYVSSVDPGHVSAMLVSVLYLMGPVATIIMTIPHYTRSKIAVERIEELMTEIGHLEGADKYNKYTMDYSVEPLLSIEFDNVGFAYEAREAKSTFTVGPVNLTIYPGEIIFISGGNGSGKSTFLNILSGLYVPSSGEVRYNGKKVVPEFIPYYSDQFSTIFTDNYLFSDNYDGFDWQAVRDDFEGYVELMKLPGIICLGESDNWIDTRLSKGQKKRLAMILVMMEKKDILLLDEWAAEQDPFFRGYFYNNLLPALKQMGKTIIAVTHDDAYYHVADRMIKFDYGRIILDKYQAKEVAV